MPVGQIEAAVFDHVHHRNTITINARREPLSFYCQPLVKNSSGILSHPDDLKAAIACVELCREIGASAALRPFAKREVMPGALKGPALSGPSPESTALTFGPCIDQEGTPSNS